MNYIEIQRNMNLFLLLNGHVSWSNCWSDSNKIDKEIWRTEWNACSLVEADLIEDPSIILI